MGFRNKQKFIYVSLLFLIIFYLDKNQVLISVLSCVI